MTEKNIRWTAEIVTGQCPTCTEITSLVGITKEFYSIEITESLDPAFYHFIIAIPNNFKY